MRPAGLILILGLLIPAVAGAQAVANCASPLVGGYYSL